jgi:hypothetical protein
MAVGVSPNQVPGQVKAVSPVIASRKSIQRCLWVLSSPVSSDTRAEDFQILIAVSLKVVHVLYEMYS